MKKIVLTDDLGGSSSYGTIVIDSKRILEYSKDEGAVFRLVVEFMNRLPNQVIDGESIKEWLRLRDHSLWWFVHHSLWRHIETSVSFILNFENMLDTIRPDVVDLKGFYDKADLIQQICRKKNVRLYTGISFRKWTLLQSIKNKRVRKRSEVVAGQKKSRRIAFAREAGHEGIDNIRKCCVLHVAHETYRRRIYDFETGDVREGEFIAQKILQQVRRKDVDILGIDVDHTYEGQFRALQQRLKDKNQYWVPFEIFEARKHNDKELENTVERVERTLKVLFQNKEFQALFNFNGISLWDTLSVRFDLLSETLPQRIRSIEVAKDMLQKSQPRSIFLLYEKGPSAMTFVIAADELGIKTVGMQHGIIHEWHPDYAISELRSDRCHLGSPIPTVTVVFGEAYKELLVEKWVYPSDRVIVGGNPTYDGSDRYSNRLDRKAVLTKLDLDPARKTVLVATSMGQKKHNQPDYDVVMIETLARSFGRYDSMQVVIKLHPKEDGMVYRKIIEQSGAANFVILDHPIEELILVCDIFLAVATTTILEAIVLEKPVIIFQHANKLNWYASYLLENGAVIGAKKEELADKVKEILGDKACVEGIGKKGSEFAKRYFNIPDKEISQSIADILIDSSDNC